MNRTSFLLIIVITLSVLILSPMGTMASNDIKVIEAKISIDGKDFTLLPAEVLKLDQGDKVNILVKFSKPQIASGTLRLLTDLVDAEGPLRFDLADYHNQTTVSLQFRGAVPDALVGSGHLIKEGERAFTLINIIVESNGIADTLLGVTSISTTPALQESIIRVSQVKTLLQSSSNDERSKLAWNLIKAADNAQAAGNPSLAISLCDAAQQALNLKLEIVDLPFWYLVILLVLMMSLVAMALVLVNQNKKGQASGWIKQR